MIFHFKKILLLMLLACSGILMQAQTKNVSGRISSEDDGKALAGVSVSVKGKKAATQTAADGTYSITASDADILIITYTGYTALELPVRAAAVLIFH